MKLQLLLLSLFILAVCAPSASGYVLSFHYEWTQDYINAFRQDFSYNAPSTGYIAGFHSYHSNIQEDRRWKVHTISLTPTISFTSGCDWSDYVNNYKGNFEYIPTSNGMIRGVETIYRSIDGDRRYKFWNCNVPSQLKTSNCAWSGNVNNYDGVMDFTCFGGANNGGVFGAQSTWNNHNIDRVFNFYCCAVAQKDCGAPPTINHGSYNCPDTKMDTTCNVECNNGYDSGPSNSITCQASETWTAANGVCSPRDCGERPTMSLSTRSGCPATTFGNTCTYTCTNPCVSVNAVSTCQADGTWSSIPSTCMDIVTYFQCIYSTSSVFFSSSSGIVWSSSAAIASSSSSVAYRASTLAVFTSSSSGIAYSSSSAIVHSSSAAIIHSSSSAIIALSSSDAYASSAEVFSFSMVAAASTEAYMSSSASIAESSSNAIVESSSIAIVESSSSAIQASIALMKGADDASSSMPMVAAAAGGGISLLILIALILLFVVRRRRNNQSRSNSSDFGGNSIRMQSAGLVESKNTNYIDGELYEPPEPLYASANDTQASYYVAPNSYKKGNPNSSKELTDTKAGDIQNPSAYYVAPNSYSNLENPGNKEMAQSGEYIQTDRSNNSATGAYYVEDPKEAKRKEAMGSSNQPPAYYIEDPKNAASSSVSTGSALTATAPELYERLDEKSINSNQCTRDSVVLEKIIGKGEFGEVWRGSAKILVRKPGTPATESTIPVAVKRLKDGANNKSQRDFKSEAEIMAQFKNANIVTSFAFFDDIQPFMIVLEYLPYGDLKSFLINCKKSEIVLSEEECYSIFNQIATGMVFLEKHNFVHRDLAARNCMVGENLTVKIGDFGLSKQLEDENEYYQVQTQGKLPIRWMAPESMFFRKFSSKSDVWSFGVMMWEVCSYGETPYADVSKGSDLPRHIELGNRLGQPEGCSDDCYAKMSKCWEYDFEKRISFKELQPMFICDYESETRNIGALLKAKGFYD